MMVDLEKAFDVFVRSPQENVQKVEMNPSSCQKEKTFKKSESTFEEKTHEKLPIQTSYGAGSCRTCDKGSPD